MLTTFEFACISIYSVGETLEQESFFLRQSLLHSPLVVWRFDGEAMSFISICIRSPFANIPLLDSMCKQVSFAFLVVLNDT